MAFALFVADIMAGRKTVGTIDDAFKVGGAKLMPMFLRRYIGYVEQFGGELCTAVHSMLHCSAWHVAQHVEALQIPWCPSGTIIGAAC